MKMFEHIQFCFKSVVYKRIVTYNFERIPYGTTASSVIQIRQKYVNKIIRFE